uniref:Cytochrome c oxidase subunit 3 n=1 Tax=Alicia sansibarensis TaxID=1326985 RepID=A0A0U2E1H7_ALISA|nr:cytochrome c oxidase subunit III [Alicia sansibarensis]AKQ50903.1 cytochrome c oxidase subunit III [Alicia sansibarensis]
MAAGGVAYFHYGQIWLFLVGAVTLNLIMIVWWRDVIREATFQGQHPIFVKQGLKYGMFLFILSEVLFFFSFFWAFFHSSLAPNIELGAIWPPLGISSLNASSVPLLNTIVLLSSAAAVTWAHNALISGKKMETFDGLIMTALLGVIFTKLQTMEYYETFFAISDSIYGATFFVATGFHGLHVIIGATFLIVCLIRATCSQFICAHHFGFEAASWYWHFVDVVWLFLYVCLY